MTHNQGIDYHNHYFQWTIIGLSLLRNLTASLAVHTCSSFYIASAQFCSVLKFLSKISKVFTHFWMFGDIIGQISGPMRKVTLVAIRTELFLHKSSAKSRLIQTRHRVLGRPMLVQFVYKITLKVRFLSRMYLLLQLSEFLLIFCPFIVHSSNDYVNSLTNDRYKKLPNSPYQRMGKSQKYET